MGAPETMDEEPDVPTVVTVALSSVDEGFFVGGGTDETCFGSAGNGSSLMVVIFAAADFD